MFQFFRAIIYNLVESDNKVKPRQPRLAGFGLAQAQQLMMDYCVSLFPAVVA